MASSRSVATARCPCRSGRRSHGSSRQQQQQPRAAAAPGRRCRCRSSPRAQQPTCRSISTPSAPSRRSTPSRCARRSTASSSASTSRKARTSKRGDVLAEIDPRTYQAQLRPGGGQEGAGRGDARQCAARPRALHQAGGSELRIASSRPTRRALVAQLEAQVKGDQARDRQRQGDARLHHDRRADRRPHRHPAWSTKATSCRRRRHGIVVITQVQPISVLFNLPQQQLGAGQHGLRARGTLPVDALGGRRQDGGRHAARCR